MAVIAALALASCQGGRVGSSDDAGSPVSVSGVQEAEPIDYDALNVDSSFYDFIYLFKSDSVFQRMRIVFPLEYNDISARRSIAADSWRFDSLLLQNVYYTILNDRLNSLDEQFDMNAGELTLREIYTSDSIVKNYHFAKVDGKWCLESIGILTTEGLQGSFLAFYEQFINDSVFQCEHVDKQLQFVTYDEGDDYEVIDDFITRQQWPSFRPDLHADVISGFDCTETRGASGKMIVTLVKIDAGYNIRLYFRRSGVKGWMLYKYENLSV